MQLNAAAVAARPTARSARRQKWKPPHPDSLSDEELAVVGAACELQLGQELLRACEGGDEAAACGACNS